MKKYKYTGGKVESLTYTIGNIYEAYLLYNDDILGGINIVDDFWIKHGYNSESMLLNEYSCFVTKEELERCFVEVE